MTVNIPNANAADVQPVNEGAHMAWPLDELATHWKNAVSDFTTSLKSGPTAADPTLSTGRHFKVLTAEGEGGPADHPPGATPPAVHQQPAWNPNNEDPNFVPPTPYHSEYTSITTGMGDAQSHTISSLEAPLDATSLLANNWNRWDLGNIDWAHPPAGLPPEALNALALVGGNPALLNAIKAGGDNGSIDGPITKDSLDKFVGQAGADLAQATKDFQTWQKSNPNADATATSLARSAALLEANATLLSNAAGASQPGLSGNVFNVSDLAALGANNPGLSPELTGAAKLWSDPGMIKQIDQAGQDPLSNPDGLVNAGNIGAWLTSNAPGDTNSTMDFFNLVASRDAVINVDTSKLTSDIFAHPEKYTAAQKAAVLQDLKDAQDRMTLDDQMQVTDIGTQEKDGVNPNLLKTNADLQAKVDQLSDDPDVVTYLSSASTGALQNLVNADPSLRSAFTDSFAKFQSGQTLTDDFNAKDSTGTQVPMGVALHTYMAQAGFFQLAMGQNGQPATNLDLTAIAKTSGNYDKIVDYYGSDIVSGNRLTQLLAGGDDPINAATQFSQEVEAFGNVVDPSAVKANSQALQDNFQDALSEHIFESMTPADLETAFGDGHGNLDENKVKQYITDQEASDPSLSGSVDNPETTAGQAFHLIKAVWDGVRAGERMVDVLKTAGKMSFSDNAWHNAYKVGVFHDVTAILGGAYLGLSIAGHAPTDPGQITADVGAGINTFGVLIVGAGRGIRSIDSPDLNSAKDAVTNATDAKKVADAKVTADQKTLDDAKAGDTMPSMTLQSAQANYDQALQNLNKARGSAGDFDPDDDAELKQAVDGARKELDSAWDDYGKALNTPGEGAVRQKLDSATQNYLNKTIAYDNYRAPGGGAQAAFDKAKDELGVKTKIDTAEQNLTSSKAAGAQAGKDLAAAKTNLTAVKNKPIEKRKQKAPSVGRGVGGVGNVVTGIGLIIYGGDLKNAGDVALGNVNIAQGAFWTTVGSADAIDGTIKFFGDTLGKIKIPEIWGMSKLGDLAPIISTTGDVIGALGGLGLTIAGVALQIEAEKKQAVTETHTTDDTLVKYGMTGGPTSPQDITGAGPLGDLTPLPGGIGGAAGGAQSHPG
jgi:Type III secretion system translocator protein, HrpF